MVYDSAHANLVLFGGVPSNSQVSESYFPKPAGS